MEIKDSNYTFKVKDNHTFLHFSKSKKDHLDLLLFAVSGSIYLTLGVFSFIIKWNDLSIIAMLVGLLFCSVGVIKFLQFLDKLLQPTSSTIHINKNTNSITFKSGLGKKQTIQNENIINLNYTLVKSFRNTYSMGKFSYHVTVNLVLPKNKTVKILTINPKEILNNKPLDHQLLSIAKPIVKRISKELEVNYSYKTIDE